MTMSHTCISVKLQVKLLLIVGAVTSDSTECGDICGDVLCTPSILNPLATPFPHQHDVSTDYVSYMYVSPSPGTALPRLAVDTLDVSEQLEEITTAI